jgi:hypothetical protein
MEVQILVLLNRMLLWVRVVINLNPVTRIEVAIPVVLLSELRVQNYLGFRQDV